MERKGTWVVGFGLIENHRGLILNCSKNLAPVKMLIFGNYSLVVEI